MSTTEVQKKEMSVSERFTLALMKEFSTSAGELSTFGPYQRKLAQHLFIKVDNQLKELEAKRQDKNASKAPIVWQNVNMQKLALDAMHRIELGLDALIPNHIHPIPYFNSALKKYDLDLRIGYEGKLYYRRAVSEEPPNDVRLELIYSTDQFRAIKKSAGNNVESYEFEIVNPFDRGEIVGGFGYLVYDDPTKNKLILVSEKDFLKSMNKAQDKSFWSANPAEMRFKTLVHRVTDKIKIDPRKINEAVASAEAQPEDDFQRKVDEDANADVIDIATGEVKETEQPKAEPQPEPEPVAAVGPDF